MHGNFFLLCSDDIKRLEVFSGLGKCALVSFEGALKIVLLICWVPCASYSVYRNSKAQSSESQSAEQWWM